MIQHWELLVFKAKPLLFPPQIILYLDPPPLLSLSGNDGKLSEYFPAILVCPARNPAGTATEGGAYDGREECRADVGMGAYVQHRSPVPARAVGGASADADSSQKPQHALLKIRISASHLLPQVKG